MTAGAGPAGDTEGPADHRGPAVRLRAERLYRGAGPVRRGEAVLIRGDRIVAVGPDARVPRPGGAEFTFDAATLLPGLIDAHTHLLLPHGRDVARPLPGPEAMAAARAVAGRLLARGITAVRDLGSPGTLGQALRDEIAAHRTPGPAVLAAGRPVTSPDGHFRGIGRTARTAAQASAAVRRLHAEGADLVKAVVTGGSLTPGTDMARAYLGRAELAALVADAHRLGMPVAAHAHGTAGIEAALAAGADTIEHCTWLDPDGRVGEPRPDLLRALRDGGATAVLAGPVEPAFAAALDGAAEPGPRETPQWRRRVRIWRNGRELARAGVPVALGSDAMYGQFADCRDLTVRARAMAAFAGWRPAELLAALTAGGARALGRTGELGTVAAGAYADLLVVAGNPAESLADLDRVVAVFRRGRRVV